MPPKRNLSFIQTMGNASLISRFSPKPDWLRVQLPTGERYRFLKETLATSNLHTVCEEAHCPNIGECWGGGTATFMVLGDVCTRGCRFCAVKTGRQGIALDEEEPNKIAQAVKAMKLEYVVITSVDRDDLPDQGANHFAHVVRRLKAECEILVEVLIPDFRGDVSALRVMAESKPDVIAHNVETVRRLTPLVRDRRCSYEQSLRVLESAKQMDSNILTKSSIMIGLGETVEELREVFSDLRSVQVDFLTLGQYLRPTPKHLEVKEYVSPQVFEELGELAKSYGFQYVASGPLVRSSYKAGEFFVKSLKQSKES